MPNDYYVLRNKKYAIKVVIKNSVLIEKNAYEKNKVVTKVI